MITEAYMSVREYIGDVQVSKEFRKELSFIVSFIAKDKVLVLNGEVGVSGSAKATATYSVLDLQRAMTKLLIERSLS